MNALYNIKIENIINICQKRKVDKLRKKKRKSMHI